MVYGAPCWVQLAQDSTIRERGQQFTSRYSYITTHNPAEFCINVLAYKTVRPFKWWWHTNKLVYVLQEVAAWIALFQFEVQKM